LAIKLGNLYGKSTHLGERLQLVYALKAVSHNLIHANRSITDGVYGVLSGIDVKDEITELGKKTALSEFKNVEELKALVKLLLLELGKNASPNGEKNE
jgi:hypothetical protein